MLYLKGSIFAPRSAGFTFYGLAGTKLPRKKNIQIPVLETYKFVPNFVKPQIILEDSLRLILQTVLENIPQIKVQIGEIDTDFTNETPLASPLIQDILINFQLVQPEITIFTNKTLEPIQGVTISDEQINPGDKFLLIIARNVLKRKELLDSMFKSLLPTAFLAVREDKDLDYTTLDLQDIQVILEHNLEDEKILLLRKPKEKKYETAIEVSGNLKEWLPLLQKGIKNDPNTVVYSQDNTSGILGLMNCLRREPGGTGLCCVFVMDKDAPKFGLSDPFYLKQLEKGLHMNVFKNGSWGKDLLW